MSADPVPLIDDKAISDENGTGALSVLSATEFSLTMFEMFKGAERREAQWRKLLDDAGYRVMLCRGIWKIMAVLSLRLRREGIGRFSMLKSFASLCNREV
jgi:hypothetical protein